MENKIKWETNLNAAITRAREQNETVLLDFHNPN
jgi:hypothetical protein